jgi:hypothetical protein
MCFVPDISGQPGRCPKLPETYTWNNADDYKKDYDLVKKTLKWLCNTPLGLDVQQRSIANAFVLEWLAGSPQIRVEIETEKLTFYSKHSDLMFSFIHGVALYMMEKPTVQDELTLYTAGYSTVASLASQSEELSKSGELKPLLKALKKNRIKEFTQLALGHKDKK